MIKQKLQILIVGFMLAGVWAAVQDCVSTERHDNMLLAENLEFDAEAFEDFDPNRKPTFGGLDLLPGGAPIHQLLTTSSRQCAADTPYSIGEHHQKKGAPRLYILFRC
ncbi:MAG: hypothetical protein KDC44_23675 [Phaeodactylibacter sp.]|nr:hypothetical protein [Phaeodactylibacter sp.]